MDQLYSIHYTNGSLNDALAIKRYLLYKFTKREVDKFYAMLAAFEKVVIVFPELYPASSKTQAIRRAVLSKQLSVFYSFTSDKISIIAILDNRIDTKKWP